MSKPKPKVIRRAADVIVEYALISLGPDFLRWNKSLNLEIAEFIWNCAGQAPSTAYGDPAFAEMVRQLADARRTKWKDAEFLILDLDVRRAGDEMVFTFSLTWDEHETLYPCEIVYDPRGAPQSMLN